MRRGLRIEPSKHDQTLFSARFRRSGADSRGVSYVEYIILIGVVALLTIAAFRKFSGAITEVTHGQGEKVRLLQGSELGDTGGGLPSAPVGNANSSTSSSGRSISGGKALALRPRASPPGPVAVVPGSETPGAAAGTAVSGAAPGGASPAAGPSSAPKDGAASPAQSTASPPESPSSPGLGRKLTEIAAGGALGAAQAVTPGGALANVVPTPTRYTEFGRGLAELGIGVLQVAGGIGEMGSGGALAAGGILGAPETAGISLAATAGGGALATAGVATTAQGASNVVASIGSIYRAVTMSDEPAPAAKPAREEPPKTEPKPQAEPEAPKQPNGTASVPVNKGGQPYPTVTDLKTGKPIPFPEGKLAQVPKAERVSWTNTDRGKFIKEWYDRGYSTPEGGWGKYDIHHIKPREFGGNNAFDNLTPVLREVHTQVITPWWNGV